VYDALGDGERAGRLHDQARALRDAFNEVFWNAEEGTFALALDGHKRQVARSRPTPATGCTAGSATRTRQAPWSSA
jgi:glycogen debranching enzyme